VRRTVPPSAEIEEQIERLLSVGVGEKPRESLSELARLGARLIIQRAVEDEFDAWLGRARYERRPDYQRGLRHYGSGLRNGFRPRTLQTAEGELEIEIPQVREAAETFASKLFPRGTKLVRTEPLKALVIGAFVRGLSMRDVESLHGQEAESRQGGRVPSAASQASCTLDDPREEFRCACSGGPPLSCAGRSPGRPPERDRRPIAGGVFEQRRSRRRGMRKRKPTGLELPRFRRHLDASGGKPEKVRFGCRGRGRRIRRSSVARRSGSLSWAISRSVSWPGIWGSPTSRCATGSGRSGASAVSALAG
jgi:hypothetical protein